MKSFITTVLILLVVSFSYSFPIREYSASFDHEVCQNEDQVIVENISIEIIHIDGQQCEMTAEVSIGFNNTYIKLTFTVVADDCTEALAIIMDTIQKAKEMIKRV
jgi:hypothetical protein